MMTPWLVFEGTRPPNHSVTLLFIATIAVLRRTKRTQRVGTAVVTLNNSEAKLSPVHNSSGFESREAKRSRVFDFFSRGPEPLVRALLLRNVENQRCEHPLCRAGGVQSIAGHQYVNVRVVNRVSAKRVQHAGEPEPGGFADVRQSASLVFDVRDQRPCKREGRAATGCRLSLLAMDAIADAETAFEAT
jgi:hypothetical protein